MMVVAETVAHLHSAMDREFLALLMVNLIFFLLLLIVTSRK